MAEPARNINNILVGVKLSQFSFFNTILNKCVDKIRQIKAQKSA
jgi:hypothetical protein